MCACLWGEVGQVCPCFMHTSMCTYATVCLCVCRRERCEFDVAQSQYMDLLDGSPHSLAGDGAMLLPECDLMILVGLRVVYVLPECDLMIMC